MSSPYKCIPAGLAFFLLLLWTAAPAGALFSDMANRAGKCGVSEEAVELARSLSESDGKASAVLSPLLDACIEQFPLESFEKKLAEGVAKSVPAAVIARVLNKKLASYSFGRELLLTSVGSLDPETLETVAQGVERGVSRKLFQQYAESFASLPPAQFRVGLEMISLQTQAGFDPELTMAILKQGQSTQSLSAGWRHFVRVILFARQKGVDDKTVANGAIRVLAKEGSVSDVLPELGFTGRNLSGGQ